MNIQHLEKSLFKEYGHVITNYDTTALMEALKKTPVPESGTVYVPSDPELEKAAVVDELRDSAFGGMPIQVGYCNGYNTKMNCLEYHRDSEFNFGVEDFILLVARRCDIYNGVFDSSKVMAFYVPKGTLIEIYATTTHYAPCQTKKGEPFRVAVILPKGTNGPKPADFKEHCLEDKFLWACNKWLLAHPESEEAKQGAFVGITGENIDIAEDIED